MIIVSKDKRHCVNHDHVCEMFIGSDGISIKVNFSNGGRYELERYGDRTSAQIAMDMLCEAFSTGRDYFKFPDEKQIQARLAQTPQQVPHHITGKKNHGHGGS